MHHVHSHSGPGATTRPAQSPRMLRAVARLLPVVVLLAWQLALAAPAHAKAGDLDRSFGTGGKVTTDFAGDQDTARALVVQGTKLVAAGSGTAVPGGLGAFALARYNPDGSLDTTFGTGGQVTTDFPGGGDANALAVQADGKLVAAGVTGGDFALARYNVDGSLDTTFGTGGTVTTDFAGNVDIANALIVQADSKLVAAGSTEFTAVDFAVARYNPDGTLDTSFGTGGQVVTDVDGTDRAYALALQGGKLVAGGLSFSATTGTIGDFGLVRYNVDGSLDTTFGTGGKVTTDFAGRTDWAFALAVQGGKLVAAGRAGFEGNDDFGLVRYNVDGSLDTTFGTGGKVTTDFARSGGSFDEARALVVQGRTLVAAGFVGPFFDFGLARYRADGTLDRSFGSGGKVTTDFAGQTDEAFGLAVQADGRLVAAGFMLSEFGEMDFALARYRA
jgi:uncharacterized delta-60 repeat protein